jgi:protein-disulfide isomerase
VLRASHPPDLYAALVADGKLAADTADNARDEPPDLEASKIYRVGLGLPGHQSGPDDALVTIVVWSDFQCPFCERQAPVLAHVRKKYPDSVRVVYRHFPVVFHRDSILAAEAGAAAAEQGKFWAFHDRVFGREEATRHLTRADLEAIASDAGLDLARFRAALDDRRFHDAVIAEGAAAEALGVDGTPTMFINGHPAIGLKNEVMMDRIVDAELLRAHGASDHGVANGDVYALLMSMAEGDDRADPSAVPTSQLVHIELRADDRARAVAAACRRRDGARAMELARLLVGDARHAAALVCAGEGIDLKEQNRE